MKAIVYNRKALPDRLVFCDVEKPVPKEHEVLIKIACVSLNAADYRSMKMGMIPRKKIFGADIAGTVASVGKKIQQFKPGDEVIGDLAGYGFGGLAEYAVAPESILIKKPPAISFQNAAAIPMAAVTALQALRDKGNIKKGDEILIIGSGGGVGTFAVQLAKHFNAEIIAICSANNIELSKSLGAQFAFDYQKVDFLSKNKSFDMIVAINGNYSLLACRKILKPNGKYVMVGGSLPQIFKSILFGWLLSVGSKKIHFLMAKPKQKDLEYVADLANKGIIKPVIDRYFSHENTAKAFHYLAQGHARGKVIVEMMQ